MRPEPRPRAPLSRSEDFLGRDKERRRLLEMTRRPDPSGAQIWGPRRIGKTWLLDWVRLDWEAADRKGPIHVSVRCQALGEPTPVGFFRATFEAIRRASPDCATLLKTDALAGAEDAGIALLEFVADLRECGQGLVLLIDEFDRLARAPSCDPGFLGQLRCVEQEANAALVVTTSLPLAEVCRDDLRTSPLFNVLPQIPLGPFSQEEAGNALAEYRGPIDKGVLAECLAQSGGWPLVVSLIAREAEIMSLETIQAMAGLLCDELEGDLRQLVDTADELAPGARSAFRRVCMGSLEMSSEHRRALERTGVIRRGGRCEPAWRCAPAIVNTWAQAERVGAFVEGGPLTWEEWKRLAAASASTLSPAGQGFPALRRLLAAESPRRAMQDARDLCVDIMDAIAASVPAVALPGEHTQVGFAARRNKGARMMHLRNLAQVDGADRQVDSVLVWHLGQLDAAGNVGAHRGNAELSDAEVGPLLLVGVEAVRRAKG